MAIPVGREELLARASLRLYGPLTIYGVSRSDRYDLGLRLKTRWNPAFVQSTASSVTLSAGPSLRVVVDAERSRRHDPALCGVTHVRGCLVDVGDRVVGDAVFEVGRRTRRQTPTRDRGKLHDLAGAQHSMCPARRLLVERFTDRARVVVDHRCRNQGCRYGHRLRRETVRHERT